MQQKWGVAFHFRALHALHMSAAAPVTNIAEVAQRMQIIRGQRVLLDADLAAVYGVSAHRLNEAVKRNLTRFPPDFAFVLTRQEIAASVSPIAKSKFGRGGRRKAPHAYTEHGAVMAATALASPRAVKMTTHVVRAFRLRRRSTAASGDAGATTVDRADAALLMQEMYELCRAPFHRYGWRMLTGAIGAGQSP